MSPISRSDLPDSTGGDPSPARATRTSDVLGPLSLAATLPLVYPQSVALVAMRLAQRLSLPTCGNSSASAKAPCARPAYLACPGGAAGVHEQAGVVDGDL